MNGLDAFAAGVGNVFSWPGILIPVAGTLLSMIASFLPGIGNTSLVVVVLVATMSWDPVSVLLLFGALTGGATFMGSITAILFNIPGNVSSTPTLLDGHPLARKGLARTAIACAATASAAGSVFGVLVLLAALPVVRPLLLQFGPPERLLIGVWGLVTIVSVPTTSRLKSALMTALGLLAAGVGSDPASGAPRWTFGVTEMAQGFNVVAVMLGMFTLAELVEWMRTFRLAPAPAPAADEAGRDSIRRGIRAVFAHAGLTMRASSIGTLVGMIPGVGGTVAGFVAYGHAVQSAKDKSQFGKGDIRGVVAPEAAVDAKDGGSLLPAVAFGLPGSEAGVALIAAFAIHGIVPGVPMLTTQLSLTFTLILALLFSNILTSVVGVAVTPWLARLRHLPIQRIALPCLAISLVTVVELNGLLVDLYAAAAFGIAGYYWRSHGWPRAPFVIAFVLGGLIETNLSLSVQLLALDRLHLSQRTASHVLLVLIAASLLWMRAHRTDVQRAPEQLRADVSVGLVTALIAAAMLAIAVAGAKGYSAYITATAGLALLLSAWVAMRGIRAQTSWRDACAPSGLAAGLQPPAEHRQPLLLIGVLPLLVWLLGLVPGVGCSVFAWSLMRGSGGTGGLLRATSIGAVYAAATWLFAERLAHLVLPPGMVWQWLSPGGST